MPIYSKSAVIGVDAFFRELHVGDEIQDLDGRHYMIDQFGRCKPLDGGNVVPLRNVKEPAFVGAEPGPFEEKPDGKVVPRNPEPAPEPVQTPPDVEMKDGIITFNFDRYKEAAPAIPAPVSTPRKPRAKRTGPLSAETNERMSASRNNSGTCEIGNMVKGLSISGAKARALLEQNGIETFSDKAGRGCIKREDRARAMEILMAACAEDADKVPEPMPELYEYERDGRIHVSATPPPKELLPGFEAPAPSFEAFSDQDLADELRRRGYEVTAIKHIEL